MFLSKLFLQLNIIGQMLGPLKVFSYIKKIGNLLNWNEAGLVK